MEPAAGTRFSYRLEARLDAAALADWFLAERRIELAAEEGSDERVVLKLFHPKNTDAQYAEALGSMARRVDEAQLAGVARVLDLGQVRGRLAVVSQHLARWSLAHVLQRLSTRDVYLTQAMALSLCAELLELLERTHAAGFTHGALNPATVGLSLDGGVVLLELGSAQALQASPRLRKAFSSRGRSVYRAPELAASPLALAPAADVFAVGALLYELLTLREPAVGPAHGAARSPTLLPPSRVSRRVSARLDAVVLRALEPRASRRHRSCADFAAALRALLASDGGAPTAERRLAFLEELFPNEVLVDEARAGPLPIEGRFTLEPATDAREDELSTSGILERRSFSGGPAEGEAPDVAPLEPVPPGVDEADPVGREAPTPASADGHGPTWLPALALPPPVTRLPADEGAAPAASSSRPDAALGEAAPAAAPKGPDTEPQGVAPALPSKGPETEPQVVAPVVTSRGPDAALGGAAPAAPSSGVVSEPQDAAPSRPLASLEVSPTLESAAPNTLEETPRASQESIVAAAQRRAAAQRVTLPTMIAPVPPREPSPVELLRAKEKTRDAARRWSIFVSVFVTSFVGLALLGHWLATSEHPGRDAAALLPAPLARLVPGDAAPRPARPDLVADFVAAEQDKRGPPPLRCPPALCRSTERAAPVPKAEGEGRGRAASDCLHFAPMPKDGYITITSKGRDLVVSVDDVRRCAPYTRLAAGAGPRRVHVVDRATGASAEATVDVSEGKTVRFGARLKAPARRPHGGSSP